MYSRCVREDKIWKVLSLDLNEVAEALANTEWGYLMDDALGMIKG